MNAADIAAAVREAVLELRASGAPLAAELADADMTSSRLRGIRAAALHWNQRGEERR